MACKERFVRFSRNGTAHELSVLGHCNGRYGERGLVHAASSQAHNHWSTADWYLGAATQRPPLKAPGTCCYVPLCNAGLRCYRCGCGALHSTPLPGVCSAARRDSPKACYLEQSSCARECYMLRNIAHRRASRSFFSFFLVPGVTNAPPKRRRTRNTTRAYRYALYLRVQDQGIQEDESSLPQPLAVRDQWPDCSPSASFSHCPSPRTYRGLRRSGRVREENNSRGTGPRPV